MTIKLKKIIDPNVFKMAAFINNTFAKDFKHMNKSLDVFTPLLKLCIEKNLLDDIYFWNIFL